MTYLRKSKKGDNNLWCQTKIEPKKTNKSWWLDRNFEIKRFAESSDVLRSHVSTKYEKKSTDQEDTEQTLAMCANFEKAQIEINELTKNSKEIREHTYKSIHDFANQQKLEHTIKDGWSEIKLKDEELMNNEDKLDDLIKILDELTINEVMDKLSNHLNIKYYPFVDTRQTAQDNWTKTEFYDPNKDKEGQGLNELCKNTLLTEMRKHRKMQQILDREKLEESHTKKIEQQKRHIFGKKPD